MSLAGSRSKRLSAGFLLSLMSIAAFSGCVGPSFIPSLSRPEAYRSDERILHRLKTGETPEILAKKYLGEARLAWMVEDANPKETFRVGRFAVIPLVIQNRAGITDKGYQTVPILCYHRFAPSCDSPLCMPSEIFEQQIRYLKENGYRVIGPEALVEFLDYRKPIPKNAVIITVDDGYRSTYDVAYPILKKYGFTATLLIYIDYVGVSRQAITWDQLRELKREGFTIGSHSIAHSDLSRKKKDEDKKTYMARLKREIFRSKQILDEKLGQDTIIFSYPFGKLNQTVASLTRQAGYKMAVTVNRGSNPFFTDPFMIKRDQILKRDLDGFASRLKTFYNYPLK